MRMSGIQFPKAARWVHGVFAPASRPTGSYTPAMVNTQFDRITVNPDRFGGKPCIRELRISVSMVVQIVAAGKTIDEILAEYAYLEAEDVKQALAYSAALAENEYHLWLRPSA